MSYRSICRSSLSHTTIRLNPLLLSKNVLQSEDALKESIVQENAALKEANARLEGDVVNLKLAEGEYEKAMNALTAKKAELEKEVKELQAALEEMEQQKQEENEEAKEEQEQEEVEEGEEEEDERSSELEELKKKVKQYEDLIQSSEKGYSLVYIKEMDTVRDYILIENRTNMDISLANWSLSVPGTDFAYELPEDEMLCMHAAAKVYWGAKNVAIKIGPRRRGHMFWDDRLVIPHFHAS